MTKSIRPQRLTETVVIIDGLSGSGKTLIAPILSSLRRGELWLLDHLYEYLCTLDHHNLIARDAAKALVDLYVDLDLYNLMIGRNTNFRVTDQSGVDTSLLEKRYRQRLTEVEGQPIVEKIHREHPILILMTHYSFGISDLLFDGLGSRLKLYLIPIRHPLWLFESWFNGNYHDRIARDPRDFQYCFQYGSKAVPWFADSWAKKYQKSGHFEQTVLVIRTLMGHVPKQMKCLSPKDRRKVVLLPFETFATAPDNHIGMFLKELNTTKTDLTSQIMRKMKIPRAFTRLYFEAQKDKIHNIFISERAEISAWDSLASCCREYESRYLPKQWRVF